MPESHKELDFNAVAAAGGKFLIAPLDWGYGHLTRSLALRQALSGCEVVWAVTREQEALLRQEGVPDECRIIPGYQLRFGGGGDFWMEFWRNRGSLGRALKADREWADRLAREMQVDHVVSDCRFGFHTSRAQSILLNHQRSPRVGLASPLARWVMRSWEKGFDELWVPDEAHGRLSGKLSEGADNQKVRWVGGLSRLNPTVDKEPCDVLVICSGPEVYRRQLAQLCIQACASSGREPLLVGQELPGAESLAFAPAEKLQSLVAGATTVISRSGYSSVMDLDRMGRKAILVPTLGQYEQQYLARYLSKEGWPLCEGVDELVEELKSRVEIA